MEALLIYLLKSGVVLGLFYWCYILFLKNETYFTANRHFLLSGILASLSIPFISIENIVWIETISTPIITNTAILPTSLAEVQNTLPSTIETPFNWILFLIGMYSIGVLFFLIRFSIQYWSVRRIISCKEKIKTGSFSFIETDNNIAPFSFLKTIVYNKKMHTNEELEVILTHEKAHCKEYHTLDILFSHILIALQWFNPFAWLYQKIIQQNLEFLADAATINQNVSVSNYQDVLLKAIKIQVQPNTITNNFHQSLIKKRIIMLHKKTNSKQLWKLLLVLPLITGFIYSCNTETVIKEKEKNAFHNEEYYKEAHGNGYQEFSLPIKNDEKLIIASEFGIRLHPILKIEKMHNGIDLKAKTGTPVYATIVGEVIFAGKEGGYGNLIKIKNNRGYETRFAQLQDIHVTVGEKVTFNTQIGSVGNTGASTGPHLHYELLKDGKYINPKASLGIYPKYHVNKNFSDTTLEETVRLFNLYNEVVQVKLTDIKRNQNDIITRLAFTSKFTNQERFFKNFDIRINNKTNEIFSFYYNEKKQGVQIEYPNKESILITKDGSVGHVIDHTLPSDVFGPNPIHFINNTIYTQKELDLYNRVTTLGTIERLTPKEAIKKFGSRAKDGAIVYHGESVLIKRTDLVPTN